MRFSSHIVKADDPESAVAGLRARLSGFPAEFLIFFASHAYDGERTAAAVNDAFPGTPAIGCSSYAEISAGGFHTGSLGAMAFGPDAIEYAAVSVAENISADDLATDKAFDDLARRIGRRPLDLDYKTHFGIALYDGSSPNTEKVLDRIGVLTDVTFIGGCASDDFSMRLIRQFTGGKALKDSVVLAVLKPAKPFVLLKTQSVDGLERVFTATKVDESARTIVELDGVPAAEAYAAAISIPVREVGHDQFLEYSLGLMANGEPFLRAVNNILPGGGLLMFRAVKEGQRLHLMRARGADMVARTRAALDGARGKLGRIAAILDFDCVHREMHLERLGAKSDYAALFANTETSGFVTFGETYIDPVNETSVMAVFS